MAVDKQSHNMAYKNTHRYRRITASGSTLLVPGYVFLGAMKAADVITTAIGLVFIPGIVETNPIARMIFGEFGTIAGVVFLGGLVVITTTMVLEMLIVSLYYYTESLTLPIVLRGICYASLSLLYGSVAIHNANLLVQAFDSRWLIS